MKTYGIAYHTREGTKYDEVKASDLPTALHGWYAANGPASGGAVMPTDIRSVSEVREVFAEGNNEKG